ncbi:MAG TPA: YqaA family protein [Thermodesulfobacteriota bacterium]|nr:YqaA family protein [Thermodesulfobacteriota bacterium]
MIRRIYDWVLAWADTRYGVPALSLVSFVESSIFPVPPDPLLMALCMGKPERSFRYAAICSAMSVLGGIFGYLIGWAIWELVDDFFFAYVFSREVFELVGTQYENNAFIAVLTAAVTPIPYKVFTVTAGVFQISLAALIAASVIGRSARFFLEAGLIYFFGSGIKSFIDKYFNLLVTLFFVLLVLGLVGVKYLF